MAWQPRGAACSRVLWWMVVGMVLFAGAGSAHGQRLIWLGTFGGRESQAYGVSADGSVVVGRLLNANGQDRAFRWANGSMQDLGTLGGRGSQAYAVSADGSVVVGWASNAIGDRHAFRWTADSGMQDLGTLGGYQSEALDVSADGSVVVGWAHNASGQQRAFRWANGVMQDLGRIGGDWSQAFGVSADGSVVVGGAGNASGQERAFRWTAEGGMQDLGTLPGYESSRASRVSADGSVVVGLVMNYNSGRWRAFRWTAEGGMQDMGTLGGDRSAAYGVSADGSVVVGVAENASSQERAFRWTAQTGMQDLNELYASLLRDGSVLIEARAISPDGRYIVGQGYNVRTGRFEAFLLDTQGTSSVEESSDGEVTIAISPQPVSDHGWVQVRLGRLQYARVEVRDVLGRLVTVLGEGTMLEQRWQLQELSPGVYMVMVSSGHNVAARQFVVTR